MLVVFFVELDVLLMVNLIRGTHYSGALFLLVRRIYGDDDEDDVGCGSVRFVFPFVLVRRLEALTVTIIDVAFSSNTAMFSLETCVYFFTCDSEQQIDF